MPFEFSLPFAQLLDPQKWIYRRTAILFSITTTVCCIAVMGSQGSKLEWCFVGAVLCFPTSFGCWWLGREFYWRAGIGERVGINFQDLRAPSAELKKTQDLLTQAAQSGAARRLIRLKVVPVSLADSKERAAEFAKKYGMSAVVSTVVSAHSNNKDKAALQCFFHIQAEQQLDSALFSSLAVPLASVIASQPVSTTDYEVLKGRANSLYEAILLFLATKAINDSQWEDASSFLSILDNSVAERIPNVKSQPRFAVRDMLCRALLRPLAFPSSQTPQGDEAEEWLAKLRRIWQQFSAERPLVGTGYARALFLCGKAEEARAVCEAMLASGEPEAVKFGRLAMAALDLFASRYPDAVSGFGQLIRNGDMYIFNLRDLIDFADHCVSNGVVNAVFLQVLYRNMLSGQTVSTELEVAYIAWMGADRRRAVLKPLLQSVRPLVQAEKPIKNFVRRKGVKTRR